MAVAAALGLEELLDLDASGAPLRSVVAGTAFLALAGWVGWAWLDMPVPVRRVLRRRPLMLLPATAVAGMLTTVAVLAWGQVDDPRMLLAGQSLVVPLTVALALMARRRVRRMAGRAREVELHP